MLYHNPITSDKERGASSKNRDMPIEADGGRNPWKALVRLGEEFNNNIEIQKKQEKMENRALLK